MSSDAPHREAVDAWADRVASSVPAARLLDAFERGFGAIWTRAHRTLGDVTLMAITDRVLFTAAGRFPILLGVTVQSTGLPLDGLRARVDALDGKELLVAVRFVMTEFLTVLGNLTAEILSPALHAELRTVPLQEPSGP